MELHIAQLFKQTEVRVVWVSLCLACIFSRSDAVLTPCGMPTLFPSVMQDLPVVCGQHHQLACILIMKTP